MIALILIPIALSELQNLIRFAYEGDNDLIEKYQAGDRTFEECVDFNYNEIALSCTDPDFPAGLKLWKVSLQSGDEINDIGYCVTQHNLDKPHGLFSYGINIHYRKSVFLLDWLKEVEKLLGVPYYTALWNKNTRAIDFFKKNGFTVKDDKEKVFKYLFKGYDLIPDKMKKLWQLA